MKRVIIVCEGETEQEFCNTMLTPWFAKKEIFIQSPLIKKTMGGIVKWVELKHQIILHLKNDTNAIVTTLIDYIKNTSFLNGIMLKMSRIKTNEWKFLKMV